MTAITVDKGVPLPEHNRGLYPWHDMEVGDSFFVPGVIQPAQGRKSSEGAKLFSTAGGKRFVPGSKWATRTVTENGVAGLRVWRTA